MNNYIGKRLERNGMLSYKGVLIYQLTPFVGVSDPPPFKKNIAKIRTSRTPDPPLEGVS